MVGVKGQLNPSRHRRANGFTVGSRAVTREQKVFSFKAYKDIYPVIMQELTDRQITTQQLCDEMLEVYYGDSTTVDLSNPLLIQAIEASIFAKESAIRAEKKKRSPDDRAIADWQKEIEELQSIL